MTSKYQPLHLFLAALDEREWQTTFIEIERILGFSLPDSARKHQAWWGKDSSPSRHARAWLEAGWNTRGVNLGKESVVFVRAGCVSREHDEGMASISKGRQRKDGSRPPSIRHPTVHQDFIRLLDYVFVHAAVIEPERDADGTPREFMPQSQYRLAETKPLNRHGAGPFCRFSLKGLPMSPGIYALTISSELVYIGIAKNLIQRWGPQGYARISPANCYIKG